MEPYSRDSFRKIAEQYEAEEKQKRGSVLVTLLIIAIFLFSGVFYVKTSKPELADSVKTFVLNIIGNRGTLETVNNKIYDTLNPTENASGESGDMLKSAENLCFDYLTADKTKEITLSAKKSTASPLEVFTVTSGYGERTDPVTGKIHGTHHGVDLAASPGSKIYAYKSGTVSECGKNATYGNYVLIKHDDTLSTFYGHMSKVTVNEGDSVRAGESIGVIGSTGKSTGTHLHFEVRKNGERVEPTDYLYEKV